MGENESEHMKLVKRGGIVQNWWNCAKLVKLVKIVEIVSVSQCDENRHLGGQYVKHQI